MSGVKHADPPMARLRYRSYQSWQIHFTHVMATSGPGMFTQNRNYAYTALPHERKDIIHRTTVYT